MTDRPPRVGADEIALALRLPRPTDQQRLVIESPLEPALVVAGAGSGKTETMASRVLWLLANRLVAPEEILGLTFTRKAAGELAARIRERLTALRASGLLPEASDEFAAPEVATYNAFANGIYRENAVLIGREGEGPVLGEAAAWQLARRAVVGCDDPRLADLDRSVDTVTQAVLAISRSATENLADPDRVCAMAARFAQIRDLPAGGRGAYGDVTRWADTVGALPILLRIADQYRQLKLARGLVEYSDQVALALEIIRAAPPVAEGLRARHRVVLLDEYQDTSVVQTWLLSELFRRRPVMAVGDPHQSIYGWRGASSANLEEFSRQFAAGAAANYSLSTSWRNGHGILAVANTLVEPLARRSRVPVAALGPGPAASDVPVDQVYCQTILEEADAVAAWIGQRVNPDSAQRPGERQPLPSAALLFRARSTQAVFVAALRRHGIPYHVLGISGLTAEPEVADLVCALSVISDPGAGAELVRLLAGSRWRLGVRDLYQLSRVASWLRDHDHAQRALDADVRRRLRASVAEGEDASIVDALDFIARAPAGHSQLAAFSEPGLARLREAGALFAMLRAHSTLGLTDLVTLVEHELGLDIEVAANETRPPASAALEALFDAIDDYLEVGSSTGLRGFLAWLREAEARDSLAPRPEDPEPGTVQLLTIHGAKGLEWDVVAVPRLVTGELPSTGREGNAAWLSFGSLPWQFRGDASELPQLRWEGAQTRKELVDAVAAFKEEVAQHREREERRLAYVAVTRARHSLLLSGSFWSGQAKPRPPSPFLAELAQAGLLPDLPLAPECDDNPLADQQRTVWWPADPLGGRRAAVERAAAQVRREIAERQSAQISGDAGTRSDLGRWGSDVELLLAERRAARQGRLVPVPDRVPASKFKDFIADPSGTAASIARPMPSRPYRATRLGTAFHRWVQDRAGLAGSLEAIDSVAAELDDQEPGLELGKADERTLAALKAIFERSEWALRKPVEVERELHLPLDGRIIVCKIDAVYEEMGRFQIVDWKTGKPPSDGDDLQRKQLQLALYRLAYARWRGVDPADVDAVFYFVAADTVIRPAHLVDEGELVRLWRSAVGARA